MIVDYYLCNRMRFRAELLERLPAWNPIAVAAFVIGAASAWFSPAWIANGLFGLLVSMGVYGILYAADGRDGASGSATPGQSPRPGPRAQ